MKTITLNVNGRQHSAYRAFVATAVLQSPSLSVSSSRKCKHGQKKELHVPWGKRRNIPRCPGLILISSRRTACPVP